MSLERGSLSVIDHIRRIKGCLGEAVHFLPKQFSIHFFEEPVGLDSSDKLGWSMALLNPRHYVREDR
ncbi:MAG: hypothetical protein RBU30_08720 [Polyangia bacterium]|nr:hypothetical protein [Polyangia bacterium]